MRALASLLTFCDVHRKTIGASHVLPFSQAPSIRFEIGVLGDIEYVEHVIRILAFSRLISFKIDLLQEGFHLIRVLILSAFEVG